MFAGQQPYKTWPQGLQPPDDPGPAAREIEPAAANAKAVSSGTGNSRLPILVGVGLGLVALASVGFTATFMLRPTAALKSAGAVPALAPAPKAAALPPLAGAPPQLADAASEPAVQAVEPERLTQSEPPPTIRFGVSDEAGPDAPPPLATTIVPGSQIVPPPRNAAAAGDAAPLPPSRPLELRSASAGGPAASYDKLTAVYDISAHTVYLPDGTRLEAHSGLGGDRDDPRFVDERDRGATPPHLYELTLRESLFHGVQALRLTPVGEGFSFDRVGLLAHPYMLGPNGDSNGCVSFKNYDAFLRAFQDGEVKRLAVVARLTQEPPQVGRLASLRKVPTADPFGFERRRARIVPDRTGSLLPPRAAGKDQRRHASGCYFTPQIFLY